MPGCRRRAGTPQIGPDDDRELALSIAFAGRNRPTRAGAIDHRKDEEVQGSPVAMRWRLFAAGGVLLRPFLNQQPPAGVGVCADDQPLKDAFLTCNTHR